MLAGIVARLRSSWLGIRQRGDFESQMNDEFQTHIALRTDDLVRQGQSRPGAERQAKLEFGSAERFKHESRGSRGLHRVDRVRFSWLDFKLGFRMLVKYPWLTVIAGFAIAFAIWTGAATFEIVTQVVRPQLPFMDGDRIIGIRLWNASTSRAESRMLHDFAGWRTSLTTIEQLGATRLAQRNLLTADGAAAPAHVAEISASGFTITGVTPLLGRTLTERDEAADAPAVAVIGHDLWQSRFDGSLDVIGQTIRLGRTAYTIVGVMPRMYAFPVAQNVWVPLRLDALEFARGEGPSIRVFGRLAAGASFEEAQAELTTHGRRAAVDFPTTHEHLRPEVLPYTRTIFDISGVRSALLMSFNLPLVLLLVLVCANVALLLFARAATRETEIVIRSALGASRGRIMMQLFAEALVLGAVGAFAGLAAARSGMRWALSIVRSEVAPGGDLPFWIRDSLSSTTVLYVAILTVLGALVAGIIPALKLTRGLESRLRQASAGSGGLRFGGVWTAVIIAQVAVTVAFPALAWFTQRDGRQIRDMDVGIPAHRYLSARLDVDRDALPAADANTVATDSIFRHDQLQLQQRLLADPVIEAVTFANRFPRMYHPHRLVDVDEGGAAPLHPEWPAYRVSDAHVDIDYFDVLGVPVLAGRNFYEADFAPERRVVIVNQSFVRLVLGGRNPIGRRLRYRHFEEQPFDMRATDEPGPWFEIVGVVQDLGMAVGNDPKVAGIYQPVAQGATRPTYVAIRMRDGTMPMSYTATLSRLAATIDPSLRVSEVRALDVVNDSELAFINFWFTLSLMMSSIALVLSFAGIYAVMSFTVSRRTREIGIRVALGANAVSIVLSIFRKPLLKLAGGVIGGMLFTGLLTQAVYGDSMTIEQVAIVVGYSVVMLAGCLLACIVPTRRALRVQPMDALRAE